MSDPVILFILAGGPGVALMATAAYGMFMTQKAAAQRATRITRATLAVPQIVQDPPRQRGKNSKRLLSLFAGLGERLSIMGGAEAQRTADLLASAGFTNRDSVVIYAFVKTILPTSLTVFAAIWLLARAPAMANIPYQIAVAAGLGLLSARGIDLFVSYHRNRRLQAARRGFPDMLELFVIASEAGLAMQPALVRIATELRDLHPDLANELIRTTNELRLSNDRKSAFEGLTKRLPLIEIGHFTQTLLQAERHGTPFSTAMRVLMRDQRADRLFRIEEKAARLPVLMTIPLIFLIMPAVFVVLIGPAVLSVLDNIIRGM